MAKVIRGCVEGVGIADNLPENLKYFTQTTISETLTIPYPKPDMEQLLTVMVCIEVVSVKAVETAKGLSNEGQNLTGCKLVVELKLNEKIKYVADEPTQPVHAAHFEQVLKSIFIVIPCEINGERICDLIRRNKVLVKPYIEDIYGMMLDKRTIFKNIILLVDVKFLNELGC